MTKQHQIDILNIFVLYFRADIVIKCEGFWKLFQLQENISSDQFVPEIKQGLYKAFSLAADAFIEKDKQNEYWMRVSKINFLLLN